MTDSLTIDGSIELLGGGVVSTLPQCAGAVFLLVPGYDLSAPQPTTDVVANILLDGERPYGRRASNRVITLPIKITAPDRATLAAAREVLLQIADQDTWKLTWTRDAGLPLVFSCFRANPSNVTYDLDSEQSLVAWVELSVPALPYGQSDTPTSLVIAPPLPGGVTPPAPALIDTYSTVSGSNWVQSTQHVVGPNSAQWNPSLAPLSDPTGGLGNASYSKSGLSLNLTGLTHLSVWAGFGSDYWATWHAGPAVFSFTLTDNAAHVAKFSVTAKVTASASSAAPYWQRVSAAVPFLFPVGAVFDYSHVTAYSVQVTNMVTTGTWKLPVLRYTQVYLDALTANPPALRAVAAARGSVYQVLGVGGTARAPVSVQAQQPGVTRKITFATPGPFTWQAPAGLTGGAADVAVIAGGGAGGTIAGVGQMGGGGGGEQAREATIPVTANTVYNGVVGAAGTPQTGVTSLKVTTASLPSGRLTTAYSATLAASGGTGTGYTWAVTAGSLPTSLSLASGTGIISGTPTVAGTSAFTVTVTDSAGNTASAALSIRVNTAVLTITTTSLPPAVKGAAYSATLAATGGTTPYTWGIFYAVGAGLPPGLTINASTGVISGVPTTTGTFSFTQTVSDAALASDSQALSITVAAAGASTLPLVGCNWSGPSGGPPHWQTVYSQCYTAGQSFGFRGYANKTATSFPTDWSSQLNVPIPAQATFAVLSWKVDIAGVLNGLYDTKINAWAASCEAQWKKNPGSLYVSLWHEADHSSTTTYPTAVQTRSLHAYVYPRFKKLAPDVPYGQILTRGGALNNPGAWVSCPATVSGGSLLDFYGVDGYTDLNQASPGSAEGYKTASQVFGPAFDAIRSVAPLATLAVAEANCETYANRAQWFTDLWTMATGTTYPCILVMPFFTGLDNGSVNAWNTDDSPAPGTIASIAAIVAADAPALTVPIGSDPPAVDGQDSWFSGDNLAVPTGLAAAAVGSGGTFAAGAYFWKITGTTPLGETTGSNEATATIVLNGSANLTWNALPAGTQGVKVYRGTTTGNENALVATLGAVTTYTDTGTAGSAATVPATNTATVQVYAHAGKSATTSAGGAAGTGSTNTAHHDGGAGAAGGATGPAPGTPYAVITPYAANPGVAGVAQAVTHVVPAGDTLYVVATSNHGDIDSVTDTKGNTYVLAGSQTSQSIKGYVWTCRVPDTAHALALTDTITVTYHLATGTAQNIWVRAVTGLAAVNVVDKVVPASGSSAAPSSGSSGTLAGQPELALALLTDTNTGGTPSAWTGGFTAIGTLHTGTTQFSTLAEQTVTSTAALTAGATIVSTTWSMLLITLAFAGGTGTSFGGGGGSSGGSVAAGNAGSGSSGGVAVADGGAGGAGSTAAGTLPVTGAQPGGGGGGAASTSALGALQGAYGGNGWVTITRTTAGDQFSTLILHHAGPDAPASLSPLVTFGAADVPDGTTEYTVPALVAGVNPRFYGTYSLIVVASAFDSPAQPREVTIAVNQYDYAGGPVRTARTSRTFTPVSDVVNGIVRLGEVTLPVSDLAPDNSQAYFTVTLTDTNLADLYLDVLFCDTTGETVIINDDAETWQAFYVDEPATDRGYGRILATRTDRTAAVSVLDDCEIISGPPLALEPGDNTLLAYAVEGAPQLGVTYSPRWRLERYT